MKKLLFRRQTLLTTLMVLSGVIILLMLAAGWWATRAMYSKYSGFSEQLEQVTEIYSINAQLEEITSNVSDYVHSGSPEYKEQFSQNIVRVMSLAASYKMESEPDYYSFYDLENMLRSYNEKALEAIDSKDSGRANIYTEGKITELKSINVYIGDQLELIISGRLKETQEADLSIREALSAGQTDYVRLSLLLALLCFGLAALFSRKIAKPVHELALRMRAVGDGQYDVAPLKISGNYEIRALGEAFNFLLLRLNENIRTIQEKNEMAEALRESRIKGLEWENRSKQARLDFLQSQINPHFLFNTLNSLVTLADLEGAGKTRHVLLRLSHLIKYNLKSIHSMVSLGDELDLVTSYMEIQKVRFGGRIQFEIDASQDVRLVKVPSMILQPIVENAIVHGLEPKEEGGKVSIKVWRSDSNVTISVSDDGIGMSADILAMITSGIDDADQPSEEKDTLIMGPDETIRERRVENERGGIGIGMRNVYARLALQYGNNPIQIESVPGQGTTVTITLPDV